MCGLTGIFARGGGIDPERLAAVNDCMKHRGPDGGAVWVSADGRVGLGHRRLAIIDLSAEANQPFRGVSQAMIAFNGEIYNFKEVREELVAAGYRFRTSSDTEVLAAAYDCWHHECVQRLTGMYVFAIVDEKRGELFIARDRVGEKPLFYHADETGLRFASELKVLLALPTTPRRVDVDALNSFLAFGYVPFDSSILAGVHKLPAAHAMRVDLRTGAREIWRYWDLPEEDVASTLTADEAAEILEPLLGRAVRRQLCADVPVGVLLSGGLDSSLVAALAMKYSDSRVTTFSVGFPGHAALDETAFAKFVADAIGSRHVQLDVAPPSSDLLTRLARQYDEPLADPSIIPTYLLSETVRREVTVALGGDGGDELFGGYPSYSWLQRLERAKRRVPSPVRSAVGLVGRSLPTGVRGRNYLEGFGLELGAAFARTNIYFDGAIRRRLLRPLDGARRIDWLSPERRRAAFGTDGHGAAGRMRRIDFRTYLPDDLLVKVDRASMLSSLEVRSPFLDHHVCEFAFSLPGRLTATEHERKIVLRALAGRVLPPQFDARRKQGFSIPLDKWMQGDLGRVLSDAAYALPPTVVDHQVVRKLIAGNRRGLANSHRIFALSMLGLWWRTYDIQAP